MDSGNFFLNLMEKGALCFDPELHFLRRFTLSFPLINALNGGGNLNAGGELFLYQSFCNFSGKR